MRGRSAISVVPALLLLAGPLAAQAAGRDTTPPRIGHALLPSQVDVRERDASFGIVVRGVRDRGSGVREVVARLRTPDGTRRVALHHFGQLWEGIATVGQCTPAGSMRWVVKAEDRAGNVSRVRGTITVRSDTSDQEACTT